MKNRYYYKHKNCMDVCIEILKIQFRNDKKLKARVTWWNLGYTGNPWVIHHNVPIEIQGKDLADWEEIDPTVKRKIA